LVNRFSFRSKLAMTQLTQGLALSRLDERGDDAALTRAVSVFEAALEEFARARGLAWWRAAALHSGVD
jgi:hypothetical protein